MEFIPIEKDSNSEKPIPSKSRPCIVSIVEAIKLNDLKRLNSITEVKQIEKKDLSRLIDNIKSYGATLDSLPNMSWNTSIYLWMEGYWELLVDLYTLEEGASDLSMSLKVFKLGDKFEFQIISVHVE